MTIIEARTYSPRLASSAGLFLLCAGFVAIGVLMVRGGSGSGWLVIGFFGLGLPVSLLSASPRLNSLVIDQTGIAVRAMGRRWRLDWRDVQHFGVVDVRQGPFRVHRMVGFWLRPEAARRSGGQALSRAISGCDGAIPHLGWNVSDLVDYLNDCLVRHRPT